MICDSESNLQLRAIRKPRQCDTVSGETSISPSLWGCRRGAANPVGGANYSQTNQEFRVIITSVALWNAENFAAGVFSQGPREPLPSDLAPLFFLVNYSVFFFFLSFLFFPCSKNSVLTPLVEMEREEQVVRSSLRIIPGGW